MATLTSQQLKDSYQSLVTIGDSITSNPTSGRLENGKGTALTAVGINTDAPANKIGIKTAVNTNERAINLYSGTTVAGNYVSIGSQYSEANANVNSEIRFGGENAGGAPSYLALATGTSTSSTERLRVKSSGDISFRDTSTNEAFYWDASTGSLGIGTSSPTSALSIDTGTTGTIAQFRGADTDILNIDGDSNAITLDARNVASLNFEMQGSEAMRIDSSGNVGIGTDSPSTLLEVYSQADITANDTNTNVLTLTSIDNEGGFYFRDQGAGIAFKSGIVASVTRGPEIMGAIYGANSTTESVDNGRLTFYTRTSGSVTEKMRIDSSGKVGIGTITPNVELDVNGEIRAGSGILFGTDTASANVLDDYEEGTFTATIAFGGGSTAVTYTRNNGYYTKIGNIVHFTAIIELSSKGTDTGNVTIGGLPFTATDATGRFPDVNTRVTQNIVVDTFLQSAVLNNTTTVAILQYNSTTDDQEYLTDADFFNTSILNVTGFYFT